MGECHAVRVTRSALADRAAPAPPVFRVDAFLASPGVAKSVARYDRGEAIFTQGDAGDHVLYVRNGGVKLSVVSSTGKEAVVAVLGPGDFFGEGCLGGQRIRAGGATAITATEILRVGKRAMARLLHSQPAMSDRFISHMLARNMRVEDDLVVQLLNSSERRLARALLLLAGYGSQETPARVVVKPSPATLATTVGTTRARVAFLMKKFKRLGFIERNGRGPLTIDRSLLSVVLRD
jgi:CRP/FNR family cyclic AMP-dependent transcriptional regulator